MKNLFKVVWRYLAPFKKKVYFLIFLSLAAAGIAAVIPVIYGRLVDQTLKGESIRLLGLGLLLWLVLSLMNSWLNRIVSRHSDLLSAKASGRFLLDLADHFLHLPFSYLKEQKIGKIINRADRASDYLERVVENFIFSFLPDFIAIIFILIILVGIHWLLSLVLFLALVAYIAVNIFWAKRIVSVNKRLNRSYSRTYGDYYEYLSGYQTVKAFSAERAAARSLSGKIKDVNKIRWQNALTWNNLNIWQSSIFAVGFVGLFGLGILLLRDGNITPGALVSFIGYMAFIFGVLNRIASNYNMINRAVAEVTRADKLFIVKTENQIRHKNLVSAKEVEGEVAFDNVNFRYPGKDQPVVLESVSFKAEKGEVIALVGESGAGKSTLIDLIMGYYLPLSGDVFIDHYNTKKTDTKSLRGQMAVVPQEVSLFHESLSFNLRYGKPNATEKEIQAAAMAANAHDFIRRFPKGYQAKVGERGVKLSVGQKQRIAIARALLRDPKILILDEATSSLDSVTEKAVQEALTRLIKGRTTFIIAHRLSTITHADRIFVLAGGRIAETGRHEELLQKENGVYRQLYEAQRF